MVSYLGTMNIPIELLFVYFGILFYVTNLGARRMKAYLDYRRMVQRTIAWHARELRDSCTPASAALYDLYIKIGQDKFDTSYDTVEEWGKEFLKRHMPQYPIVAMNLNQLVSVRLTPDGLKQEAESREELGVGYPHLPQHADRIMQLHEIMYTFGPRSFCGAPPMFESNLIYIRARRHLHDNQPYSKRWVADNTVERAELTYDKVSR